MSLSNVTPTIWVGRLLANLHKSLVYAGPQVVNREFEGEIRQAGDSVKIIAINAVTVGTYTVDTNIGDPESLLDADTVMTIDRAKYYNFQIDDVIMRQSNANLMEQSMREAAYGISDESDQYVAGLMAAGAHFQNLVGTDVSPKVPTSTTAYQYLIDLDVKLSEQNVPKQGRFGIVPPWFLGLLRQDDRFVNYGTQANRDVLENGMIGRIGGMTIYESNNVPNTAGTLYKIIAGHQSATGFADALVSNEMYRPEKRFATAMKGLHLYGAKVIRPAALAVLTANKS